MEKAPNVNLEKALSHLTKRTEPIILELLKKNVSAKFQPIALYQIKSGGKRLRPALTLLSCLASGGKIEEALYPAAGLEILHNFTLIADDIIDNGALRRNKPTVWKKFGHSLAQCAILYYSASIFQSACFAKKHKEITEIFAQTIKSVTNGEIFDILFERQGRQDEPYIVSHRLKKISRPLYLQMIKQKTASLFSACCRTGALCAPSTKEERQALADYGLNLGAAFQIKDDVLDIFGEQKKIGKKIGKDITERKGGNLVLLLALTELNKSKENKIAAIMKKKKIFHRDIVQATQLIKQTKAKEKALALGQVFVDRAKASLKSLPQNKHTQTLSQLADFSLSRPH